MKITAHIPTQQYGYIELADLPDDVKEIERLYNKYAEKPITLAPTGAVEGDFKKVTSFTGEEILWDELHHKGLTLEGDELLGGSTYASQQVPFDRAGIIRNCSRAWGVPEEDIDKLWSSNSASELGTSIHSALEHYFLYKSIGAEVHKVKKDSKFNAALPSNEYLREIVLNFEKDYQFSGTIVPEALVSDVSRKRAGWIDFLEIVDEKNKVCIINDFKTGGMKETDLLKAQHQMSFYDDILSHFGWTVSGRNGYYLQKTSFKKVEFEKLKVKEN